MTAPVTVEVFEPDGTTPIATVPVVQGVQWREELNVPGTGQFQLHLDVPVLDGGGDSVPLAALLTDRNVVRFARAADDHELKLWRLSGMDPVTVADKTDRWCTVSGRGLLADCEVVLVFPEIVAQASTSDVRAFNFASPSFASILNPAEWLAPVGVRQDADTTARHGHPKPWHDGAAQVIWSSDPETSAPIGRNWFRNKTGTFVLADPAEIIIEAAADNYAEVWLDGERIILTDPDDPFGWKDSYEFSRTLAAGQHTLAAAVDNWALSDGGNNPGGFLCDIYTTDSNGDRDTLVLRTNTTDWVVKAYGDPPGWTFGAILVTLHAEAVARGDIDAGMLSLGFDGAVDSNGHPWSRIEDITLRVGDDLLSVVAKANEVACDVWTEGFVLHAAPRRGTDLHSTVEFTPGADIIASTPTFKGGPTRNAALIRWANRWVLVEDPVSIAAHGRREVFLTAGDAGSIEQAGSVADAAFVDSALPEITIPLRCASPAGPQVGTDCFVGDMITGPGLFGDPATLRMMAATGSVDETSLVYDLDLYPEP